MLYQSLIAGLGLLSLAAGQEDDYERTLNIVAHSDDDLLFINPQIIQDISAGRGVRTVFLTAGDAGLESDYWMSRESGTLAAYAEMAGVSSEWEESQTGDLDKEIPLFTLKDRDDISVAFLHLPDGSNDGNGFASTGNESMEKLWKDAIAAIGTVDGSGTVYTRDDLIDTLAWIIDDYDPDYLNAQDYIDDFGMGDHSDHTAGALFANEAAIASAFPGTVTGYIGYNSKDLPANVQGEDLEAKKAAFYVYSPYDSATCTSDESCSGTEYELWIQREYPRN
ncbi:hypothetical protein BJX99DRAFT_245737 [Aspergillus californicus]